MTASAPPSQTLSRGIRILEVLADASSAMSIDELAAELQLHRSIVYRLLRTLEEHALVSRDPAGLVSLAPRLASLAAAVSRDLQAAALPELTATANDLGMTCFLAVLDRDQCVTLASVEPHHTVATMVQHPGASHPVWRGAPGKAILTELPVQQWPFPPTADLVAEVDLFRERGWATSRDEVIPTVRAIAVPLRVRGQRPAAIAVVHIGDRDDAPAIAARLHHGVAAVRAALGDRGPTV